MDDLKARCAETVYVRDTYRRSGRSKSGFAMHYTRQQCSRKAQPGRRWCWQHPYNFVEEGSEIIRELWKDD